MRPEHAQAIYFAGQQALVTHLCELHAQVVALQQKVKEQEKTIAQLSENSSNSSKPPSSDITKPKGAAQGKKGKQKIGGQPGHPKHTRPVYPAEAINSFYDYELVSCPHCGGHEVLFIEDQPPRVIQQLEVKEIVVVREEHRA